MNNAPNLRFKEFSEDWEKYVLGDIFDFYTTNSFSRDFLDNDKGTVKNIHYGDIHMKFPTLVDVQHIAIPYVKEEVNLSRISLDSYCKDGDVIIADASEDYNDIGKAIELKNIGVEKVISGLHTILARDNKEVMVNGFRGYLMSSPSVRKQIKVYAAGAKVLGISKANIGKINVMIPSCMEQEKMASLFSLIDKKIALQIEKVEELKNYKRGIMQKMFPRNGENVPELRFSEFSDAWQQCKFGDMFSERREKTTQENEGTLLSCAIDGMFLNSELFSHFRGSTTVGYLKVKKHDLILSTQNLHLGNANVNLRFDCGIISPAYKVFEFPQCDSYFIQTWVKKESTKKFFLACTTEGASVCRKNIDWKELNLQKIYFPKLEEQEKIGAFFSNLDKLISLHQDKLQVLNQYKKGLLQQMFI